MIKKWIYLLLGVTFLSTIQGNYNLNIGGPVIIPTEEEIVLQTGQNFTILCKSHRPLQFKKEELSEDSTFSDFHLTETTIISENSSHTYTIKLELTNIDEFAVGYYACFDNTVDPDNVLVDVLQEPTNTPHISYIYAYVNGTEKVVVPMSDILKVENDIDEIVIKCRPTLPDVNMTLVVEPMSNKENIQESAKFHPKLGFTVKTAILKDRYTKCTCKAKMGIRNDTKHIRIYSSKLQKPKIEVKNDNFISGETFTIRCYINSSTYNIDGPIDLTWKWPNTNRKPDTSKTNLHNTKGSNIIYRNITITNASKEDEGYYHCNVTNGGSKPIKMNYREPGFFELTSNMRNELERNVGQIPNKTFYFNQELKYANPQPEINYYFNGKKLTIDENTYKYETQRKWKLPNLHLTLTIRNVTMDDSGEYKCVASNGYKNETISKKFNFIDGPFITFDTNDKELVDGQRVTLRCSVQSNPMREVKWYLDDKPTNGTKHSTKDHINESMLEIELHKNTIITCESGGQSKRKKIIVYELNNSGFGIKEKKSDEPFWISQNENAVITCIASNNKYSNCTWLDSAGNSLDSIVTYSNETLSYKAKLEMENIKLSQAGNYTCVGIDKAGNVLKFENIYVQVAETKALAVIFPKEDQNKAISPFNNKIEFKCEADGIPPPRVQWKKDGIILSPANTINITTTVIAHSTVKSTVIIKQVLNSTSGKYECIFKNNNNTMSRSYTVTFIKEGTTPLGETGLAILASVLIALVLLVVYLTWRMWKDKKQLRKMGMGYFKQGRKLNPNLGLDEQADMLPYDERFEFPRKKLSLGELLGSGAFGAVYKAEARGIINAERTDIVAVKMVKKDADLSHIVALASELKIMIHLGKHVNIVNLLGACTKNLVKSELLVIVEYCEFGNLHNYVRRHREVFIDQLTDNSTKYGKVNRGYSCSNNSNTGTHVDYSSDANLTQNTDHTFLNTGQSNRSTRRENKTNQVIKGVEDASERSMDKRSESNEYSDGRQLRPLSSRDLLAWSFQIARGMDYLAKRKVFHGDLAARNILLANDNVVKICDFGLARSMYKNEEYLKQENSLLPVKWLAIECMTERAFSTQSDIWAYGIVLWELFSLAMSPYPNVSHSDLLEWLQQGNRLEKPAHADDRLYEVMLRCWHHKPQARPNFSVLEETLGSFLDENDRNHYVDLNQEYINYNLNHGGEDYLAMIAAPEYNIATPNINDYVNVDNERRFFPRTPLPEDDQGYLQVTPKCGVTPRDHNKFEFKTRRSETESHELTPMLSTNNLPSRSISESDQEGNISPYPKMCPRIDEEDNDIDDVFENNQHNIKNTVTNPTYITITADIEKKPVYEKKEFLNNYVNVSNGLVK